MQVHTEVRSQMEQHTSQKTASCRLLRINFGRDLKKARLTGRQTKNTKSK